MSEAAKEAAELRQDTEIAFAVLNGEVQSLRVWLSVLLFVVGLLLVKVIDLHKSKESVI